MTQIVDGVILICEFWIFFLLNSSTNYLWHSVMLKNQKKQLKKETKDSNQHSVDV